MQETSNTRNVKGGKKHLISDTMCSNENPAVISIPFKMGNLQ